jgi:cell division protein FtsQ
VKHKARAPLLSTPAMQRAATFMFAVAALLLLASSAAWLAQRPLFDLRHVELRAAGDGALRHVNANAARAATLGRLSGNFFTMNLDHARRVFESVPWVAEVSVRRAWPDRLIVTLAEHRAVAIWDDGRLLADSGRLFVANAAEAEVFGALPQVEGPVRLAADAARRLPLFAQMLQPHGLTIDAVEISKRASWTLRADSGLAIELGRDDPPGRLDERLALVVAHFPAVSAQLGAEPARIDARYPQGFAVATGLRKHKP